ncbi:PREDICTED: cleft lip and palate transmembrane protein 1 homolog [Acropora digitifera]|uniref:cleft lip and palate transmembrane protein 1 homolog n=1 Tax=Acropora digitifera TaxID=70779 RepID=UPI00077A2BF8|nr:PREDICTED: cleft lip and palate transmembrane protein 1 homolog [Acropora digitifera]
MDGTRLFSTSIQASKRLQNNGTLYAHVFVTKHGKSPDPMHPKYNRFAVVNSTMLLTVFRKKRVHKTVNLLTGKADAHPDEVQSLTSNKPAEVISYWHPNLTINLMDDQTPWTQGAVPQPLDECTNNFPLRVAMVFEMAWRLVRSLVHCLIFIPFYFCFSIGFIMMTPQLFINYKLKSVAHLPWRMMTYKALNTFIDDLFAFVIKMPTLYRLGCFRDDIVFFIALYQRWIYPIDPKRVNEFGTTGEPVDNAAVVANQEPKETKAIENGTTEAEMATDKKND